MTVMGHRILIVSDSTGSTAEHVLQAALAQFDAESVTVELRAETRTLEQVQAVVSEAQQTNAMLVHTLATTELRREIYMRSTERGVHSVDLLGNLLSDLTAYLGAPPGGVPGGLHKFDETHHRRTEALTFVVKHDDGCRLENLGRAEIVLVGISRTSKTPLSIYLAVRGYFVANVPIVYGVEPPQELFRIDQRKIVGMRMDPNRLNQVRQQRLKQYPEDNRKAYVDANAVQREVQWADDLFTRSSWPVVDISLKSLEEVAVEVVSLATNLPYRRTPEDVET
jgi:[pyruvate, water dikinase]-phosphate phosphotransferase / [pyruvate, water dikinase] kinase